MNIPYQICLIEILCTVQQNRDCFCTKKTCRLFSITCYTSTCRIIATNRFGRLGVVMCLSITFVLIFIQLSSILPPYLSLEMSPRITETIQKKFSLHISSSPCAKKFATTYISIYNRTSQK